MDEAGDNRVASFYAFASGALLMAAGFSGVVRWARLEFLLMGIVGPNPFLRMLFLVVIGVASLGGIAVILGGFLIRRQSVLWGKLLILLGTGFGTAGFLLFLVVHLLRGDLPLAGGAAVALVGITLSVVARWKARM